MTAEMVTKRKWFWPWQDQLEEDWRTQMSQQGLHLQSVGLMGRYRLVRGDPTDYVYRLDFQSSAKEELDSYLQLFKDAGWEHVGAVGGWHYFRTLAVDGHASEIFTDVESAIQKYQRVQIFSLLFFCIEVVMFIVLSSSDTPWVALLFGVHVVFLVLFGAILIKLRARIAQLKRTQEQIDSKAG